MPKTGVMLLFFAVYPCLLRAQTIHPLTAHAPTSIRGISAPNGRVIWASGSGGAIGRSTDAGLHWTWVTVPGYEKTDFRDIEGFSENTAVIMGVDTPAVILRTVDGGAHWTEVFRDNTPGMFLDAMAFSGASGAVVGDPVGGRFFLATTSDRGATWHATEERKRPLADSAEGCFASSGTNICPFPDGFAFVSGGPSSRLFKGTAFARLPLLHGTASTGANSLGINDLHWIIVGGDYAHDTISSGNCLYSRDGGAHWAMPHKAPHGYRSCVVHLSGLRWVCCGTSGVDVTEDGGRTWNLVSTESYHTAAYPGSGKSVYLAGARGRIGRLDW